MTTENILRELRSINARLQAIEHDADLTFVLQVTECAQIRQHCIICHEQTNKLNVQVFRIVRGEWAGVVCVGCLDRFATVRDERAARERELEHAWYGDSSKPSDSADNDDIPF